MDEQPVLVPEWTDVLVVCVVLMLGQVLHVQQHGVLLRPQLVSYQQVGHQLGAQSCRTPRGQSQRGHDVTTVTCLCVNNKHSWNVILSSTPAESVTSLQSLKALRIHVLLSTSVGNYDLHIYTQWFLSVDILWAVDRQTSGLLWIAALCCFTVSLYLHFCESYIFLHSDGFIVCSQTSQLD